MWSQVLQRQTAFLCFIVFRSILDSSFKKSTVPETKLFTALKFKMTLFFSIFLKCLLRLVRISTLLLHILYHTICLFTLSFPLNIFCLATPCNLTSGTLHGVVVESVQLPLLSMFIPFYLPYSLVLLLFNIAVIRFLDFSVVLDLWKLAGWISRFPVFNVYLPLDLTICSYLAAQVNDFFFFFQLPFIYPVSCRYLAYLFPLFLSRNH